VSLPSVCVILPVLDEYDAIDPCLRSLRSQDYQGEFEVIVADGGSSDGTLDRLRDWQQEWASVRVVDNPDRVQSAGLWVAASATDAAVLVRTDAHTTYAPDYISRSVDALTGSDSVAVGGPLRPDAGAGFAGAVAQAMTHSLGVGPARFHSGDASGSVDTVYLGAFRRADFLAIGGMRTLPSRVAEDADLYYRWRKAGHSILLDPAIRSSYTPRATPSALWRQFYRYGLGKADMLVVNGELPSWRPLVPAGLVMALLVGALLMPFSWWPIAAVLTMWVVTLLAAMRFRVAVVWAAMIMHASYGLGLVRGLLRRPSKVRAMVEENTQPE
jgi:glycosyltransferase involved in cell wall biosynthesis